MCGLPIAKHEPCAALHVPMARIADDEDNQMLVMPGMRQDFEVRAYDVCVGCARGLLKLKPSEMRAIDEGVELAMRRHNWGRR